ncbi:MAG: LysM peptidoglycan-binding domain-containing protein [Anaerolineae bacterium]|nr:LysM peptidoglycan-binding domain-containing protein [Anaerolineae bacterium]
MKKYLFIIGVIIVLTMLSGQVAVAAPEFQGGGMVHYVTWGESLSGIAFRYGVSVEAILMANGLANPDMIYVGQPLVIPGGGPSPGYQGGGNFGCGNYHTVRTGDTLSGIAWDYNTSLHQLLQLNNFYNKDILFVGQRVCVPVQQGYAPQPGYAPRPGYQPQPAGYRPPAASYYHTVAPGETLSGIAYRYGVSYWTIMQANNLTNSVIWVGQPLIIPGYQGRPDYVQPPVGPGQFPDPIFEHPVKPEHKGFYEAVDVDLTVPEPESNAPEYQPGAARPSLPRAEHPIEVVVNGGETWADDIYPIGMDPDGITTLIVQTGEENGKTVRVRSGDAESNGESSFTGEFGAFRFVFRYIPPGEYDVWVDDPDIPSEKPHVTIGPGERVEIYFSKQVRFRGQTYASPDGWVLSNWENPSKPGQNIGGWSNILVKTPASGLNVIAESDGGGYRAKCFTGSKGPGACDFAGLMAGIYYIWIDGTDLKLKTYMDGNAYATFEFAHQAD